MIGSSKILTVSYGTFSCTLEGFDEPFSTMRGIAEYFRDLAADDRYFGAEPPTPDAETLHRIAEREVQRRVEARVSPEGIVLKQADDQPARPETMSQDAEEPDPGEHGPRPTVAVAAAKPARDTLPEADEWFTPEPTAVARTGATVAERLARIREVVAQTDDDERDEEDDQVFPNDLSAAFAGQVDDLAGADDDADDDDDDDLTLAEEAAALADKAEAAEALEETEEPEEEEQAGEDLDAEPDYRPAGEARIAAEAVLHAPDFADAEEPQDEPEDELAEIDLSAILAPDADARPEDAQPEEAQAEEEDLQADEDEAQAAMPAVPGASDFAALVAEEEAAAMAEAEAPEEDDVETVSRLLRMRRADFEASASAMSYIDEAIELPVAAAFVEAEAEPVADADAEEDAEATELSDEDEADLIAELARATADADQEMDSDLTDEPDDEDEVAPQPDERATADTAQEPTVRRLLDVTNSEMAETEGSRRRSAIAHLKAAVAATRADRIAAQEEGDYEEDPETDETDPYREDLARAVHPRRMSHVTRAISRRLPPLMLVSEQRVDIDPEDDDGPPVESGSIRPRRIVAQDEDDEDEDDGNIFSEAGSFAEFAREMDARELPELLEAAAAYYHYVEGQPHFSRPQIMNAVASMDENGEFSREESLRSFGLLLRHGKIRKIRRGQFEIDDSTRFRPQLQAGE